MCDFDVWVKEVWFDKLIRDVVVFYIKFYYVTQETPRQLFDSYNVEYSYVCYQIDLFSYRTNIL